MVSFFTHLEIYSLLSIQTICFAVIIFAKKISGKKDNLKKIYDLSGYFCLILFCSKQLISKGTFLLIHARKDANTKLLLVNIV